MTKCRKCGKEIWERSPGYWDNVYVSDWPCADYEAHEPEEEHR